MKQSFRVVLQSVLAGVTLVGLAYPLCILLIATLIFGIDLSPKITLPLAAVILVASVVAGYRRKVPFNAKVLCAALMLLLTPLSLAIQGEFSAAAIYVLILVVLAALIELVPNFLRQKPWIYVIAGASLLAACWFTIVGARVMVLDLIAAALALVIVLAIYLYRAKRRTDPDQGAGMAASILVGLVTYSALAWTLGTLIDRVTVYQSWRTELLPNSMSVLKAHEGSPRLALALSGGGYRAALLHAGVMHQLAKSSIHVHVLSSISGGSIAAAAEMSGVGGEQFVSLVSDGVMNLRRELVNLDRVGTLVAATRIPFTGATIVPGVVFSRTDAQASVIERGMGLKDSLSAYSISPQSAAWIIGSTDILGRAHLGITADGLITVAIRPPSDRLAASAFDARNVATSFEAAQFRRCRLLRMASGREITVSEVVAASGAFPAAFNAMHVAEDCGGEEHALRRSLVDGGVIDNYGVVLLEAAAELATRAPQDETLRRYASEVIIVSDGSYLEARELSYVNTKDNRMPGALAQMSNAIDTMYSLSANRYDGGAWSPQKLVFLSLRPFLSGASLKKDDPDLFDGNRLIDVFDTLSDADRDELADVIAGADASLKAAVRGRWRNCLVEPLNHSPLPSKEMENIPKAWILSADRAMRGGCIADVTQSLSVDGLLQVGMPDLETMAWSFVNLSTLEDRISREEARNVFSLGRALVILNLPKLRAELQRGQRSELGYKSEAD